MRRAVTAFHAATATARTRARVLACFGGAWQKAGASLLKRTSRAALDVAEICLGGGTKLRYTIVRPRSDNNGRGPPGFVFVVPISGAG